MEEMRITSFRSGTLPERAGQHVPAQATPSAWEMLRSRRLDPTHLARNRVITAARTDPTHMVFDVLRTRLIQALKAHGWRRVAITSPTKGCGKTFVAANLALSLARRASVRTVLTDLDLRLPSLASVLGVPDPGRIADVLSGGTDHCEHMWRIADNLAVALNAESISDAAELLQEPSTAAAIAGIEAALDPDVHLFDLPPALVCDDVSAVLPMVDGVLLVVGGGLTTAEEVRRCERLFEGHAPLLGVVFNRADDAAAEPYYG